MTRRHATRSLQGDGARTVNPKEHAPKSSWWAECAQPEDRETFIAAAHARHIERLRHENHVAAKRNWALGLFPPKLNP